MSSINTTGIEHKTGGQIKFEHLSFISWTWKFRWIVAKQTCKVAGLDIFEKVWNNGALELLIRNMSETHTAKSNMAVWVSSLRSRLLTQLHFYWSTNGGKNDPKIVLGFFHKPFEFFDQWFDLAVCDQFGWKMPTQKTISSFFNTSGTKRTADDAGVSNDEPQNKSSKTDETSPSSNSNSERPVSKLSPEQRARMEANREQAKKKLLACKSPQFFGASWKKALGAEFTKEYFVKVRAQCLLISR